MARPTESIVAFLLAGALLAGLAGCSRTDPPWPKPAPGLQPAEAPSPAVVKAPPASSPRDDRERLRWKMWEEGVKKIRLLDPDEFPEAPPELRQALQKLGCRIPQTNFNDLGGEYFDPLWTEQDNLIPGHFKNTTEVHWAVLCSRSGETSLLLFDSFGENMEKLEGPEKNSQLMVTGRSEKDPDAFSWSIDVADQQDILKEFDEFGRDEKRPPTILQEALSSTHSEKVSTIYYWHRCKWVPVTPPGC